MASKDREVISDFIYFILFLGQQLLERGACGEKAARRKYF